VTAAPLRAPTVYIAYAWPLCLPFLYPHYHYPLLHYHHHYYYHHHYNYYYYHHYHANHVRRQRSSHGR